MFVILHPNVPRWYLPELSHQEGPSEQAYGVNVSETLNLQACIICISCPPLVYCKKKNIPGPCCSKLTMSLVNDSLKFTSSDTQIY